MNDDELLSRLQAADPARTSSSADSWIPDLVEATMSNSVEPDETDAPAASGNWWKPLVAAAVLIGALGGGYALISDGSDDSGEAAKDPTSISLALPGSDAMSMCMAFDVETLKNAQLAFSGTVTSVTGGKVTVEVDHWFKGGTADLAVLDYVGAATQVALDGVEFTEGSRYLISGGDGGVGTCGYSGPWSADFEADFKAAFES